MNKTVTLHKNQWAAIIRILRTGCNEGAYYVGKDDEEDVLMKEICDQTGMTVADADAMEPERDYYVPKGEF